MTRLEKLENFYSDMLDLHVILQSHISDENAAKGEVPMPNGPPETGECADSLIFLRAGLALRVAAVEND